MTETKDNLRTITVTPTPRQAALITCPADTVFFGGSRGGGKGGPYSEKVVTPFGIRRLGDLKVGDTISSVDGGAQKVLKIYELGERDIYKLKFIDGAECRCTDDHLWVVKITCHKSKHRKNLSEGENLQDADWQCMTFDMIKDWLDRKENAPETSVIKHQNLLIPLSAPIKFTRAYKFEIRNIDPYVLGALLGNGGITTGTIKFTTNDVETLNQIKAFYPCRYVGKYDYIVESEELREELRRLKLLGCACDMKFIPEPYKLSSIETRRALIQGLMDTDGTADDRGHCSYCTTSLQLAKDIQWVIWSLGGKATITESPGWYRDQSTGEKVECKMSYDVYINTKNNADLFRLPRKKERCKEEYNGGVATLNRRIVGYEYVGREQARCILVSQANSLYLMGDFCVTHNTYGAGLLMLDRATKYGDKLNAIFFRRTNSELEGAISEYQTLFSDTATWRSGNRTFQFWNGATLKMRFIDSLDDTRKYQGHEYGLMIFDEVTNFDNWNWIQRLQACLRSTEIPTQCILSGNPGGPLHLKLKSEFINPWPEGGVLLRDQYSQSLGRWTYKCFLPSKLTDNPYLMNTSYEANLRKVGTPEQIRQWLYGDWNISVNAAFSDLWRAPIHVIKPFRIPATWEIWKSYDYGSLHPWGCVWFAISDGCDFIASDGSLCPTTPGDIFAVRELYGRTEEENVGDQAPIETQAMHILHIEETVFKDRRIAHSLADSAIFAKNSGYCIADEFEKYGVYWERCTKYPGSREHGFVLMRERLLHSLKRDGQPGIYWFTNCINSIRTIPELQMEKDGTDRVATGNSSEDHLYDLHCYMLLAQDYGKADSGETGNY